MVKVEQPGGTTAGEWNGVDRVVNTAGNPVVISPMNTRTHTPTDRLTDKMKDAWLAEHSLTNRERGQKPDERTHKHTHTQTNWSTWPDKQFALSAGMIKGKLRYTVICLINVALSR